MLNLGKETIHPGYLNSVICSDNKQVLVCVTQSMVGLTLTSQRDPSHLLLHDASICLSLSKKEMIKTTTMFLCDLSMTQCPIQVFKATKVSSPQKDNFHMG